jgi:uncharacterized protein (TIGR00269 family)
MPACSKCSEPAITFVRTSGQHRCREHFLRSFDKRAKQTVQEQGKLPKGTIAIALSGGKDSVSLLHFLHELTANRPDVELLAISIDEGIEGYRGSALDICKDVTGRYNIPWHVVKTKDLAGYSIDEYANGSMGPDANGTDRPACGPCGVFRRLGINQKARELGCVAVATGHNLDDTAQTILMNVLGGDVDRLARLAPHDQEKEGLVPRILPFRMISEKDVLLYAILNDLPLHHEMECPYAARAHRFFLRDKILELEERSPGTRHSLVRFQDKVKPLLVAGAPSVAMKMCTQCGEPTSGVDCKVCAWKQPS